jgi:hypothetical protein
VKEYYDVVNVVFIHSLGVYGTAEVLGAFASKVKYKKDDVEYEELMENDEFSIIHEIVFTHIEEEN